MGDVLTIEEQDALVGRVVREKKAAEKRLALLKEESARIGKAISHLPAYLQNNPKHVWIDGLSTNENHPDPHGATITTKDFDPSRIAKITSEIWDVADLIRQLSEREHALGI